MTIADKQAALLDELGLFQDWTERYEYVIGLGKKLAPMPEERKPTDSLIEGCQSQVWLDATCEDGRMRYLADSDSLITKGMIALFVRVLDGQSPDDVLTADMAFIDTDRPQGAPRPHPRQRPQPDGHPDEAARPRVRRGIGVAEVVRLPAGQNPHRSSGPHLPDVCQPASLPAAP